MLAPVSDVQIGSFTVCVVTVTYGDRWHLLSKVLDTLCCFPAVTRIIVVDNGASYNLDERIWPMYSDRVEVVGSGRNEGSARGFGTGLKAARESSDTEFIWILDDDNCPEAGALDELKACYFELGRDRDPQRLALMALRTDRQYLMRVAHGADPKKVFARENSFLDFHILDAPKRVLWKLLGRHTYRNRPGVKHTKIPFGIYGGLLFHKQLLDRIGYPDEDFYLYGDDNDFTARISENGGELFLVPGSRITDIERSWHVSGGGNKVSNRLRRLALASDSRVYYSTRNSVILSLRRWRTRPLVWHLNKVLYLTLIGLYMFCTHRTDRYHLIQKAVSDGMQGEMKRILFSTSDPNLSEGPQ